MQPIRFRSEQSINGVKIKRLAYGGGGKNNPQRLVPNNDGFVLYIGAQCNFVYLHVLRESAILVSGIGFFLSTASKSDAALLQRVVDLAAGRARGLLIDGDLRHRHGIAVTRLVTICSSVALPSMYGCTEVSTGDRKRGHARSNRPMAYKYGLYSTPSFASSCLVTSPAM